MLSRYHDLNAIQTALSLMNWDRQVLMPPGGTEARTAHVGRLSVLAHEILVSEEFRRAVDDLERASEPGTPEAAMARVLQRELRIKTRLPTELVRRKAQVSGDAYEAWKQAKAEANFSRLAPFLQELFDIARETAERLGYTEHIYDPLIDLFEEGATHADAARMFEQIKQPIVDLVRQIQERGSQPDDRVLRRDWDQEKLREVAEAMARAIGYDFERGRLDIAPNAFCTNFGPCDVRMTTRPSEHLKGIVSSSLHEMGHGLYEQGTPPQWARTPLAGGISLAVHESQSRTWENIVGRSRGFWTYFLPKLQAAFPALDAVSLDDFVKMINRVQPEFIRVGADELTYNLHILVRFEMECEILTGEVTIDDMSEAWNAKYEAYLGIRPPNDALGVLQDVHWSRGSVGYFPTYAMGNMIGAQIWRVLEQDLGNTDGLMADGHFKPILGWLQERVYAQAKLFPPRELVTRITGRPLETKDWLEYVRGKYRALFTL